MKQILALCGLFALVSGLGMDKWQTTEDGGKYLIQAKEDYNWFEALHECARHNMSLLAMDTVHSYEQISKLLEKLFVTSEPNLWLAGHDNALQNRYEWITTGQLLYFTNWRQGEPNGKDEHCIALWKKSAGWYDVACSRKLGYICEEIPLMKEKNLEFRALKTASETQTNRSVTNNNFNIVIRNN